MKRLAFFLVLVSLSFQSLVWQFSTDGAITAKPMAFQGSLIVASDDGSIYGISPATGSKIWQTVVGKKPNEIIQFDNALVVSTTGGRVVKFDRLGRQMWATNLNSTQYNVSYVYGASANAMEIFVTASNGIYSIGKNGTAHLLLPVSDSLITPPAAGPNYVIYGINDTLYKLNTNTKGMDWTITLDDGAFWAPAVIDGNILYVGALDGMMHAYSVNGGQIWQARTRNWVMGTPLVSEGRVYFGSNDGGVYAVDSGSGSTRWVAQTQMAVQTMPEKGTMGGRNVIFAGAGDNSAYAIDIGNGEIVWKGSATGAVGSPLFYENKVIFGSQDRNVYAYSTERACSILSPREANVLGLKEVVVSGRFVSAAGGATVLVSVNGQPWEEANVSGAAWEKYVKPRGEFKPGLNIISCKVSDNGGEESGGAFTSIAVNHDPNIPLSTLMVTVSPAITENVPFIIYVNDGDDGSPVDRFGLTVDGKTLTGDKNMNLSLGAGTHGVLVKKEGFNDAEVSINVSSASINPAYPAVGGILILIIVWRAWSSFRAGRARKK